MRKINEEELENIIRDVINEQVMMEATDEGFWGGVKSAAKQVGSDMKNAWNNMMQAYKYGAKEQDINRQYPAQNTNSTAQAPQQNRRSGNEGGANATSEPQPKQGGKRQKAPKSANNANAPKQQQPQKQQQTNAQAQNRINFMRVPMGDRMIRQTIKQLISNYGLNHEQVYNALVNAANDVKNNKDKYFPQTNESILSNADMERLTEEIVSRIRKG